MNVLVTGGAGYIGSHACKALHQAGFTPVTYDNLSQGHRWAVKWGPLEQGDLLDMERLRSVFRKYDFQAIVHFAALISVGASSRDPLDYYQTNVGGTIHLLQAAREFGVLKVIFSSTAALYGNPASNPIQENFPLQPINPYGRSKMMVEHLLRDADLSHQFRFTALRYFNAAGADPSAEIGEAHSPETHLIPIVLEVANAERKELMIFGDDYPTPDGTCVRDYIHVADLAAAHVLALRRLIDGGSSEIFNLGAQTPFSVREILKATETITGKKITALVAGRREGDPAVLVADSQRARNVLGWKPTLSDIDSIIKTAWQWKLRHPASSQVA